MKMKTEPKHKCDQNGGVEVIEHPSKLKPIRKPLVIGWPHATHVGSVCPITLLNQFRHVLDVQNALGCLDLCVLNVPQFSLGQFIYCPTKKTVHSLMLSQKITRQVRKFRFASLNAPIIEQNATENRIWITHFIFEQYWNKVRKSDFEVCTLHPRKRNCALFDSLSKNNQTS